MNVCVREATYSGHSFMIFFINSKPYLDSSIMDILIVCCLNLNKNYIKCQRGGLSSTLRKLICVFKVLKEHSDIIIVIGFFFKALNIVYYNVSTNLDN